MIIEFVGPTGAGKSALAEACADSGSDLGIVRVDDVLMDHFLLRRISNPSAKNLIFDFVALPYFLVSLRRHRAFAALAIRRLVRDGPTVVAKLNYMRSIVRRIGVFELLERRHKGEITLVDEGTVLIAYLLFVYTRSEAAPDEVLRFSQLVPVPDGIVQVTAHLPVLIDRAASRPDARRELRQADPAEVGELLGRADAIFDVLLRVAPWRERVLKVDNSGADVDGMKLAASSILEFIREQRETKDPTDPHRPSQSGEAG